MFRLASVLCVMVGTATWGIGQGLDAPKVEVVSLGIHKLVPSGIDPAIVRKSELGTKIGLLVRIPGRHVIEAEGKFSSCKDDKGTDLMKDKEGRQFDNDTSRHGFSMCHISKDGTHFSDSFWAPGTPAVGATRISLKAKFDVLCGQLEKTEEAKDIVWDDKLAVSIGPFRLKAGKNVFGETCAIFVTDQNCRIRSVMYQTVHGKGIAAKWEQFDRNKAKLTERSEYFGIEDSGDHCTVRVTYFTKVELFAVAVDIQVAIGF